MSRDRIASVRLTDAEHERLTELAKQRGLSLSDYLRELVRYACAPTPALPQPTKSYSVTVATPANIIWNAA